MEIYLDNCATTRVCPEAAEAAMNAMVRDYGNPSSLHKKGLDAEHILTAARKEAAALLGCAYDCVYFTGGATDSNNIAIQGALAARPRAGKTIVTTTVEHSSVGATITAMEKRGYTVKRVAPRADGHFDPYDFLDAVDEDTVLLSMMMVNNEMGTILPYDKVIPAVVRAFIHREGPATAHFMGGGMSLTFGSLDPDTESVVQEFFEALEPTPIKAKIHPDILRDVWMKAMLVTCFGALGAVMEEPIGVLRTTYRETLQALMTEAANVARSAGIQMKDDAVDIVLSFTDAQPGGGTASMQRDILDGLHSELDSQVGGIVRCAKKYNTSAPLHQLAWETLAVKSNKLRGQK